MLLWHVKNRLGNMALLRASKNVSAANSNFDEKKKTYEESALPITRQVLEYESWATEEINDRQAKLSKLAVKTWSVKL